MEFVEALKEAALFGFQVGAIIFCTGIGVGASVMILTIFARFVRFGEDR